MTRAIEKLDILESSCATMGTIPLHNARTTASTMGCVTEITSTGDNDEPIVPVTYYRHYLYCDSCGSFDLQPFEELQDGFWGWLFRMKDMRGVRCAKCQATYRFGTKLFTQFDENPRGFTMADVPRPLHRAYSIRGKTIPDGEKT